MPNTILMQELMYGCLDRYLENLEAGDTTLEEPCVVSIRKGGRFAPVLCARAYISIRNPGA